jgi:hypothetical protein
VNIVKYAPAFRATGLMIRTADAIAPVRKPTFEIRGGPALIGVHVNDNHVLFESALESSSVIHLRVHRSQLWTSSSEGCCLQNGACRLVVFPVDKCS